MKREKPSREKVEAGVIGRTLEAIRHKYLWGLFAIE